MKRRNFLALVSGAAAGWPLAARAQQAALPRRIGFLLVGFSPDSKAAEAFRRGLREAGYAEGHDVAIEWRVAGGDYTRVPELIADLIRRRVEVMVHDSTVGTEVAKRSTSTIPIVMALVLDPVASGLVKSLANPGGNVTGLSMHTEIPLHSKRLQFLKEIIPDLTRAAVMWNPDHPLHGSAVENVKTIGPRMSIELSFVGVRTPEQLASAFSDINQAKAQALMVMDDPIFFAHRTILLQLASAARLPTMHDLRRFPEVGALMSYGADVYDLFRRSATYVDRILKGARPSDLPVEQPTKFELVINLKTAKALNLTVSDKLIALADGHRVRVVLLRCLKSGVGTNAKSSNVRATAAFEAEEDINHVYRKGQQGRNALAQHNLRICRCLCLALMHSGKENLHVSAYPRPNRWLKAGPQRSCAWFVSRKSSGSPSYRAHG